MALSIGIVGLPNVGKSTVFNALTKQAVPAENYPFCTIDPCVGVIEVPDERLEKLTAFSKSKQTIPASVAFVDIAGLVRGASKGEGLGNNFLSHIRETDAILHMVRCFEDEQVLHVDGAVDPVRDIEVIETELLLADLALVEKRLISLEKGVKKGEEEAKKESEALKQAHITLKEGHPLTTLRLKEEEEEYIRRNGFLSRKPVLYVCNVNEYVPTAIVEQVRTIAQRTGSPVLTIAARSEKELSEISQEEANILRGESDGIATIVRQAYATLGLISFFTTGEKETRAWTIPNGSTAKKAAGVIHTDFEKNFIRAEVIPTEALLAHGSYANARAAGAIQIEGKEYKMVDGDVVVFRVG